MFKILAASLSLTLFLPSCDSANADQNSPSDDKVSTAIIQIFPSTPVLADPALRTENFIANEIFSLSTGMVLDQAAKDRSWEQRKDINIESIKRKLKVERIPGTDMARITAYSDNQATAKEIVEAIINAYISTRKLIEVSRAKRHLDAIDEEIIAQSDKVQDHRKDLTVLIQQYGIPYFEGTESPVGKTEIEMFDTSRKRLMDLEIESLLLNAKFKALEGDEDERKKLEPQIRVMKLQIEALSEDIDDRQGDVIDLSLRQHNYSHAKQTYLQSRNMLRDMKAHQQEARLAVKMPKNPLMYRQRAE